jgi:hypothetical protein
MFEGISAVAASGGPKSGQKVEDLAFVCNTFSEQKSQVSVLSLFLTSPSLPPGQRIELNISDPAHIAEVRKNPITIKEGVEYKYVVCHYPEAYLMAQKCRINFPSPSLHYLCAKFH